MKNYYTELTWAGIFFLMYLAWMIMEHLCGLHGRNIEYQQLVSTFILLPSFLIYFFALREKKRKAYQGAITFSQAFKSGVLLTLFVVLLSPLSQIITHQLIAPEYFQNMREFAVSQQKMSVQDVQSRLNTTAFIIQSVIGGIMTGSVFSFLISMLIKNKRQRLAPL